MEQEKVLRKSMIKRRARGFLSFLLSLIMAIETFGSVQIFAGEYKLNTISVGDVLIPGEDSISIDDVKYNDGENGSKNICNFNLVFESGEYVLWYWEIPLFETVCASEEWAGYTPPAGQSFIGWKVKSIGYEYNSGSEGYNCTVYFNPEFARTCSITYHVDGVVKNYTPSTYVEGVGVSKADMPAADAKANYNFDTWYSDPEFTADSKMEYIPADATGDLHLYARYTPKEYDIIYETNGGTFIDGYTAPAKYTYGVGVALPTSDKITNSGKVFGGWYDNSDLLGDAITEIGSTISGAVTVYAQWVDKEAAVPVVTIDDYEYDSTAHEAVLSGIPEGYDGTVTVTYIGTGSTVYAASTTAPKNAGTYSVTAATTETATYAAGTSEPCEFTISKADITLTAKPKEITYGENGANDGFECTGLVNDSADELFPDIDYYYTHNDGEMPYNPNSDGVGSYLIRIDGSSIPDELENYNITDVIDGTLTVNPKSVTAVWDGEDSYEYNGTAQGPTVTSITGLLHEETFTVSGNANTAVGSYTASVAINGDAKDNYTVTNPTYGYSITAAEVDPTVTVLGTYTYDGTQKKPTKVNIQVKVGDTVLGSDDFDIVSYGENINAGIEAGSVTVKSSENGSYIFANKTAYFNIGKATPNFSVSIENWEYGGTASTPTISGTITGDGTISYSHKKTGTTEVISGIPTDAGDYTLYATSAETTNYKSYTAECGFSISPKAATVTGVTANSRTYDGTEAALVTGGTVTGGTLVYEVGTNDTDAPEDSEFGETVPNGKNAGDYYVWYYAKPDSNHTASAKECKKVIIAQKNIAVTITGHTETATYDTNVHIVSGYDAASTDPLFDAAKVSCSATASISQTDAGTYDMGLTAGNFTYNDDNIIAAFTVTDGKLTINKAGLTLTVEIEDWTYGGTANTPIVNGAEGGTPTITYVGRNGTTYAESGTVPTQAGDYTVKAAVAESANYEAGRASADFTITATAATVTGVTANNRTYDGTEAALVTGGTVTGGTLVYAVGTNDTDAPEDSEFGETVPNGKNAGDYYVWYYAKPDSNHTASAKECKKVTVAQKNIGITITGHTETATYDKNVHTVSGYDAASTDTLFDAAKVSCSAAASISQTDAGTYDMGLTAGDFIYNDDNIIAAFTVTDGKLTINKAGLTLTVAIEGWTYGGTANAPTVNGAEGGTPTITYVGRNGTTYAESATVPTQAGDYTVKAAVAESANYEAGSASADFTISRALLTIEADDFEIDYGSAVPTFTVTYDTLVNGDTAADIGTVTYTCDYVQTGIASNYDIIPEVTIPGASFNNYSISYNNGTLTVKKLNITPTISIAASKVYDGTPITAATVDGNPGSGLVTFYYTGRDGTDYTASVPPAEAGKYSVYATVGESANYNAGTTNTADFEITAADIDPTVSITGWTYGSAANAPTVTGNTGGGVETITYSGRNGTTYAESATVPTQAGDYTVKVGIAATDNYNAGTATADFSITAKTIGITWGTTTFEYDGNSHVPTAEATGVVGGDTCDITVSGEQTDASATPYTATASITNTNYALPAENTTTFTVSPKTIGITWGTTTFEYDGNSHVPTAEATGVVGGDTCDITVSGEQTDASATPYTATASITNTNYALPAENTTTFTVSPKTIGITWGTTTFEYDGNSHVPTAEATGVVGGDTCDITVSGEQTDASATPYTATASITNTNYALPAENTTTFTVSPKTIGITWGTTTFEYDGNSHVPTAEATGVVAGDTCDITVSGEQTDASATPYTATASITNTNYALPAENTTTFTVSPKTIGITWGTTTFEYDGNSHVPTAEATGVVGGDTCDITVSGEQTDASATPYTATASITNTNYALPAENTTTFTVSPKTIGITWGTTTFEYDGNSHVPTAEATGVVTGDTCDITVTGAETNVGDYTATASITNTNYALPAENTKAFSITAKAAVVKAVDASKDFGASDPEFEATVEGTIGTDTVSYTLSREPGDDVGEYTITPSGDAVQGNYTVTYQTGKFTIAAVPMSITAPTANTLSYTGADMSLVTAGSVTGGEMKYALGENDTTAPIVYDAVVPTGKNAKTYYVWYTAIPDGNHIESEDVPACVTVNIVKTDPAVTAPTAADDLRYTGEPLVLIKAGSTSGGTMKYSLEEDGTYSTELPTGVKLGVYTVWYRVDGDENYNDVDPDSIQVAVTDFKITPPTAIRGLIYNSQKLNLIIPGSTDTGIMVYSLDGVNYSEDIPQAADPGVYTVYYKVVDEELHIETDPGTVKATIGNRPTHSGSDTPTGGTTGTPTVPAATTTEPEKAEEDDVNLTVRLNDSNNIVVSWNKLKKAKKYVLYAKKNNGKYAVVTTTNKLRVVIKNPKNNTTYSFLLKYSDTDRVVSGKLKNGTGKYTASLYVSVMPKIMSIKRSGSKNNMITWSRVKGATMYYIYRVEENRVVRLKKTKSLKAVVKGSKSTKYIVLAYVNGKWTKKDISKAESYNSIRRKK